MKTAKNSKRSKLHHFKGRLEEIALKSAPWFGGCVGAFSFAWFFFVSSQLVHLALACGLFSVALGAKALELGRKSDEKMAAIADSRFDDALGTMTDYSEPAPEWMNMLYHTRAGLRLAQWATETTKGEFRRRFNEELEEARKSEPRLAEELKKLRDEYGIDNW